MLVAGGSTGGAGGSNPDVFVFHSDNGRVDERGGLTQSDGLVVGRVFVHARPLRIAGYLEPFSLAIAQLAYEGDEGPEIGYRIERFGK